MRPFMSMYSLQLSLFSIILVHTVRIRAFPQDMQFVLLLVRSNEIELKSLSRHATRRSSTSTRISSDVPTHFELQTTLKRS
jgi:hypothetical protein